MFTKTTKSKNTAPEPPAELVSFVERLIRDTKPFHRAERRSHRRYLMAVPISAQPVDDQGNPLGPAFSAMTRDISPIAIGLIHTERIEDQRLAIQLSLAGERVNLLTEIQHCSAMGPYYHIGAKLLSKLDRFPS